MENFRLSWRNRRNSLQGRFAISTETLQRLINPSAASKLDQLFVWSTKIQQVAISAQQSLQHPFSNLPHPYLIIGNNGTIFNRFSSLSNAVFTSQNTNFHHVDTSDNFSSLSNFSLSSSASSMKHFPPIYSLFFIKFTSTNVFQLL